MPRPAALSLEKRKWAGTPVMALPGPAQVLSRAHPKMCGEDPDRPASTGPRLAPHNSLPAGGNEVPCGGKITHSCHRFSNTISSTSIKIYQA